MPPRIQKRAGAEAAVTQTSTRALEHRPGGGCRAGLGGGLCWVVVVWSLSHVQFFVTPRTVARQPPLSVRFPRQEYWSGLHFFPPEDLFDSGIEPASPALSRGFFTTEPLGKQVGAYVPSYFGG